MHYIELIREILAWIPLSLILMLWLSEFGFRIPSFSEISPQFELSIIGLSSLGLAISIYNRKVKEISK